MIESWPIFSTVALNSQKFVILSVNSTELYVFDTKSENAEYVKSTKLKKCGKDDVFQLLKESDENMIVIGTRDWCRVNLETKSL